MMIWNGFMFINIPSASGSNGGGDLPPWVGYAFAAVILGAVAAAVIWGQ